MKKSVTPPKTIDDYLAPLGAVERRALERLRRDIRLAAPGAVECISYGIPAFRLNGKFLVGFGAAKNHLSFYPGAAVQEFGPMLAGRSTGKGTVRFAASKPLPSTLVRMLVRARVARMCG